jgi:hypothetical protein
MEIFIYYVLPNVLLFGGIYLLGKYVENATADYIENYEVYQQKLLDYKRRML